MSLAKARQNESSSPPGERHSPLRHCESFLSSSLRGTKCRSNLEVNYFLHISSTKPGRNKSSFPLGTKPLLRHCEARRAEAISNLLLGSYEFVQSQAKYLFPGRHFPLRHCDAFLSSAIARRFSSRHCEARSAEAISKLITFLILVLPNPGETNLPFLLEQSLSPSVIARHTVPKQSRS